MDELKTLSPNNPALNFCHFKCWLAYKGDIIVGRIAAIINPGEQKVTNSRIARFGWYDFIDDYKVSSALMETACQWLKQQGTCQVHGPMGFTDMDRQGLLIEGHHLAGTMATNYNFAYYQLHLEKLKFAKSTDWVEFLIYPDKEVTQRIGKLAQRCQKMHQLTSLKFSSHKLLKARAKEIFQLINDSYSDLYGYIPLNKEQIDYYTTNYLSFVNLKLISVVTNEANKIIGVGISMPSFTKALQKAKGKLSPVTLFNLFKSLKTNDCADLYLIAIDREYQGKGVNSIIMNDITTGAMEIGVKKAETNIELEDNKHVQKMWRFFNGEQHKRRRCYIKEL
jgi:hypothetical protein